MFHKLANMLPKASQSDLQTLWTAILPTLLASKTNEHTFRHQKKSCPIWFLFNKALCNKNRASNES